MSHCNFIISNKSVDWCNKCSWFLYFNHSQENNAFETKPLFWTSENIMAYDDAKICWKDNDGQYNDSSITQVLAFHYRQYYPFTNLTFSYIPPIVHLRKANLWSCGVERCKQRRDSGDTKSVVFKRLVEHKMRQTEYVRRARSRRAFTQN